MKPGIFTRRSAFWVWTVILTALPTLAQKPIHYEITDLGTLGGTFSAANDVNDNGQVAGLSTLPGDSVVHAFLWDRGLLADLGTLGGPNSIAFAKMNARGEVAGFADTSVPDPLGEDFCGFGTNLVCLPSIWFHGRLNSLPILNGDNGAATSVNNRGQVTGISETAVLDPTCTAPLLLQYRPVVWTNGKVHELPTFGDPDGEAIVSNDRGQIIGRSGDCTNPSFHALIWRNSQPTDMGNFGGAINHTPSDLNNRGQVVGSSDLPGDETGHAFLWEDGVLTDLGTLPGDFASAAYGINSKGEIVGGSYDADGNSRPFLLDDGVMTDLNTLVSADSPLYLLDATGRINAHGQIAGIAFDTNTGEIHADLATPRKGEPSSSSSDTRRTMNVNLPDNIRAMLRRNFSLHHETGFLGVIEFSGSK